MKIKIYQINHEKDNKRVAFEDYKDTIKYAEKIAPSIYKTVFDGEVDCDNLEEVYSLFNIKAPVTHQGHALSVSDIIQVQGGCRELVGKIDFLYGDGVNAAKIGETICYTDTEKFNQEIYESQDCGRPITVTRLADMHIPSVENGFYFCDSEDFVALEDGFDCTQAEALQGVRMLVVEPHKAPYEALIPSDYRAIQRAVGGNFECAYLLDEDDDAFIFCNENGKLEGLEGNREICGDIIAGTFLISRDDGYGHTTDLTDEQVQKYSKQFEADETYTQEEVEDSMYMHFIGFDL